MIGPVRQPQLVHGLFQQLVARVVEAAQGAVKAAAARAGLPVPSAACVQGLFVAQIEAASAVQERVLARPAEGGKPPDLEREIRPALARLTPRIAAALVALPRGLAPGSVQDAVARGLRAPDLDLAHRQALEAAILRCAAAASP